MVSTSHVKDLLAAYALNCLDETDALVVAEHLSTCQECRQELLSYEAVVEQLPLAAPQVDPPERVKQALMSRVQAAAEVKSAHREGGFWWVRLQGFFRQLVPVWGLASLVLVTALVTSNLLLWQQVRSLGSAEHPASLRTIQLGGTDFAPNSTGLIVVSVDGEHGTMVVDRLPALDEDHQYQLWLIEDGTRTSGGVFSVNDEGYGSVWVKAPNPLISYSAFGITIEPAGGSPGPTGEKVLGSDL